MKNGKRALKALALSVGMGACCISAPAWADPVIAAVSPPQSTQEAPPAPTTPPPTYASIRIPEGTEVSVRFNEQLSSATSASGDSFSITTDEPITLEDGTVIPAGYRGKGEVTGAEHKGMMGKPGQLNVRLDYVRIGDKHVHLRASKGAEGKSGLTSTIVLTVLFGPLGLIKHGSDVVIAKGQSLVAYVDEDAIISAPIAPPPHED